MEATSAPRPHGLRIPRPRRLLAALSDERLVEHVRSGDAIAFEVLYDRYSAGILGFCRHMLGSLVDAEDAVQQTFIAAHSDIQRHDRRELHVKAWLYTIARNRCLSTLRARREHPSEQASEVVTDNLLHDIEQREDVRALLADVTKLPDDQREALVLAEIGDLSHRDIGAILGCEVSKVKSLVFQARSALVDRRVARETPCTEIREQLATLRGGALRRSPLRHHLEACPGCSAYRDEIRRQRAMLALALPVIPSAALRANVLGGLGIGGGTAAAGAGAASGVGLAAQTGLAKLGVVAALAAGGAGGATVANNGHVPLLQSAPSAHESTVAPVRTTRAAIESAASTAVTAAKQAATKHTVTGSRRSARGSERGFTPVPGESNGARARAFAQTRGKGKQISAERHATANARVKPNKPAKARTRATPTHPVRAPQTKPAPKNTTTAPRTAPAPEPKKTAPAPDTTATPQSQDPAATPTPDTTGLTGTTGKSLGTGRSSAGAG